MDYYFRGTGHVRGGIGALAWGLLGAAERAGVEVRLADRARSARRDGDRWIVSARGGDITCRAVVANLLPQATLRLLDLPREAAPDLDRLSDRVEEGWGAAMLYRVVAPPPAANGKATHLELVRDPRAPFTEGNHVFCSISGEKDEGRAPDGLRTMTVSTHVPLARLRADRDPASYVQRVQDDMRATLDTLAPEWCEDVRHEMSASPRTFERFTGRPHGYVGGVPRRAGLDHYRDLLAPEPRPGLFLVGDSVFPGQSTLATALGGVKVADRVARRL